MNPVINEAPKNKKEVVQSNICTFARYDFDVYQKRILYAIVCGLQGELKNEVLNHKIRTEKTIYDDIIFTIPISNILDKNDRNYQRLISSFMGLMRKLFVFEVDAGSGEIKKIVEDKNYKFVTLDKKTNLEMSSLISNPKVISEASLIHFTLPKIIYESLFLNFTKGYSKYQMKIAFKFSSTYSMRFYEIIANNSKPLTFKIETLKEMFGIQKKYQSTKDFKVKIIDKSKKELDQFADWSFNYQFIKFGRKYESILFMPYYIAKNDETIKDKVSITWDVSLDLQKLLLEHFRIDKQGIKNNIEIFKKSIEKLGSEENFVKFLNPLQYVIKNATNPAGYLVGILKNVAKNDDTESNQNNEENKRKKQLNNIKNNIGNI